MAQGHNALCKEMTGELWAQCHDLDVLTKRRAWLAQGLLCIGRCSNNIRNKKAGCLGEVQHLGKCHTQVTRRQDTHKLSALHEPCT